MPVLNPLITAFIGGMGTTAGLYLLFCTEDFWYRVLGGVSVVIHLWILWAMVTGV